MAMTSKQRLGAALKRKPVDRVPMMILLGETWLIERKGISFKDLREMEDLGTEMIVTAYDEVMCDNVTSGLGCWIGVLEAAGCPTEYSKTGAPIEVKPCIKDFEKDIAALDRSKIREQVGNHPLVQKIMEQTRKLRKAVGEEKFLAGQLVGPFSAANMMVDVKEFMTLLGKKSPYLAPLLEYATDFCAEIIRLYRENGADTVQICDPCSSGDMISPKMYDQYVVPTLKNLKPVLDQYEYTMLHVCGKAGMRIPRVVEVGFDGFSVDSPVDLRDALTAADGKLTMMGNFDPNGLLRLESPEKVYAAAYANLEVAAEMKGGYVMMPGCDMAATTPVENIKAMVRASMDFAAAH